MVWLRTNGRNRPREVCPSVAAADSRSARTGEPSPCANAFTGQFWKPLHPSGKKTKARTTSFRTGIEEELQAEANAEQWLPVLIPGLQEWNKACCFKTLHGRVKGAYSRKDQRLTAIEIIW